jgi:hypothetical protein
VGRTTTDDWDGAESDSADVVSESEECFACAGGAAWGCVAVDSECGRFGTGDGVSGWMVAYCYCDDGIAGGFDGTSMRTTKLMGLRLSTLNH